jgi:peptidoglycan/LPS O-acetylase OafA/YrhL
VKYQPALDGLRAICIALVFLYHCRIGAAPSGFVGVDVFFVLSGYLITHLVCLDVERYGRLRVGTFFLRRARRLLPALWLSLLLAWAVWDRAGAQVPFTRAAVPVLLYVSNWVAAYQGFAALDPLGPTWSLAIEVQFYLVWPFLVWLLWKRESLRTMAIVGAAAVAIAFALMRVWVFPYGTPLGAYTSTLTRVDVLLTGGILALLERHRGETDRLASHAAVAPLAAVALAGIVWIGWWNRGHAVFHHGIFTLVAVLSATVIARVSAAPQGWISRVLQLPPLVALGKRSYGIYLYHYPIIQLTDAYRGASWLSEPLLFGLRLAAVLVISWVSFRFVEEPIRRWRWAPPQPSPSSARSERAD